MKDFLFTLTFIGLLVVAATRVSAQVTNQRETMSRGSNDALTLELPSADDKMVSKLWADWLKDTYKVKTKKTKGAKTGELSSLNFSMAGVGAGTKVDMYSRVDEAGNGSELTVWIATPDGYISPEMSPTRYVEAEKMLMRFALNVSRAQIEMEVEEEEKNLKELEKEMERLRKDKERAEKEIVDARQKIADAEAVIERNIVDQETKQREIEEQIRIVEQTKRRLRDF